MARGATGALRRHREHGPRGAAAADLAVGDARTSEAAPIVGQHRTAVEKEAAYGEQEFRVAMPHLASGSIQLERGSPTLLSALHFLARTDLSEALRCTRHDEAPLLGPRPRGREDRITLVLDLDETLVHCRTEPCTWMRHSFCVGFEESAATGWIYERPFARLFLEIVSRLFEVVVFTASSSSYADQVLNTMDPDGRCITTRLYRQHCTEVGGGFLKDMHRLGRPLDRVVLVDNSPISLALCPDNGVLVSCWVADQAEDRELVDLLLLLQQCMQQASVPSFLAQRYGLGAFLDKIRECPELLGEF